MKSSGVVLCVLCLLGFTTAVAPAETGEGSPRSFIFVFGESSYAYNVDLDQVLRLRKARSGDFLWFRHQGRAYIVTDAAVLAAGRDILQPSQELGREQQQVRDRLKPFEVREQALDREEERLDERADRLEGRDDRAASEEGRRLEALRRDLEARRQALEAGMREIEVDQRRLEEREREIERVADAKVARLIHDALRRGLARPVP